jgi:conjugative relaxase-like TrwC/TraI family protein
MMLQIDWMKGTGTDAAKYFTSADYFLENDVEARWQGKHAETLGLVGKVTFEDLKGALNNRSPLGGKITQRDTPGRRCCLHAMFSAPKSVSVMEALAGDTRLRTAFDSAVSQTMQEIERHAQRRVRVGGQDHSITTGNLVYANFDHRLGRPVNGVPDPQMHSHGVIINATYDKQTNKWYALDGDAIKTDAPYFQAFFRATLAKQIEQLGYKLKYDGRGDFEIDGIDKKMRDLFSGRTFQVEDTKREFGYTNAKSIAGLAKMNREDKNSNFTWEQLQKKWIARLNTGQIQTIRDTYANALGFGSRETPDFSYKYTEKAIDKLTHQTTWVPERKVMTEALKTGLGKVSVEGIQSHLDYLHSKGQIMRKKRDREELTTKKARDKQIHVEDLWKAGMGKHEKLGRDTYNVKEPSHIQALKKLMGSRDRFMSMRGNIGRPAAMERAAKDVGAAKVKNVNALPQTDVWFVDKIADGDLPELMEKAVERDARVVFWGDKNPSELEERLRLDPYLLFDRKETKPPVTQRLKEAVLNLLRRGDVRENEHDRRIEKQPEKQWQY